MNQLQIHHLVDALEAIAPTHHAEPWDNVGLIIGDPSASLSHVLLTIDLDIAPLRQAQTLGCEAIVAYHPPIFKEVRKLLAGDPAYEAVRAGIAVYSPHTALDVATDGTNDALAQDALGMQHGRPLELGADGVTGLGRIGELTPAVEREQLFERIKCALSTNQLLVAGPKTGAVKCAAVCAGACGVLMRQAINQGAELYLTGELRHHDAITAARHNMTVVCALHSNSERLVLKRIKKQLLHRLSGLEVTISDADTDPFDFV